MFCSKYSKSIRIQGNLLIREQLSLPRIGHLACIDYAVFVGMMSFCLDQFSQLVLVIREVSCCWFLTSFKSVYSYSFVSCSLKLEENSTDFTYQRLCPGLSRDILAHEKSLYMFAPRGTRVKFDQQPEVMQSQHWLVALMHWFIYIFFITGLSVLEYFKYLRLNQWRVSESFFFFVCSDCWSWTLWSLVVM